MNKTKLAPYAIILYGLIIVTTIIAKEKDSFLFWCLSTLLIVTVLVIIYVCIKYITTINRCTNFLNKGESEKAINIYSKSVDSPLRSTRAIAMALRGITYIRIKKYDLALKDLIKSAEAYTIPLLNISKIGIVYCELEEYDKAFEYFMKAAELKPKSSVVYNNLGWFYCHTREYDKAIENLNRAVSLSQGEISKSINLAAAYTNLGFVYTKQKEYFKANDVLYKAIKLNVKAPLLKSRIYRNYAYLQRMIGSIQMSMDYAIKAIRLDPYEDFSYKILAELNLMQDDYDDFYKNFEIFLSKKGKSIDKEEIEDIIYDKVKNEEKFKMLLQNHNSNFANKHLDLNITINADNNKRFACKALVIITIFLLVLKTISMLMPYKQPVNPNLAKVKNNQSQNKQSKVENISDMDNIYNKFEIDKDLVVKNSPKFGVSWSKTKVRTGEKVGFDIKGVVQTAKADSTQVLAVEKYGDDLVGNYTTPPNEITILNLKTGTNNQIQSYIFIMPDNEKEVYEYDTVLTKIP